MVSLAIFSADYHPNVKLFVKASSSSLLSSTDTDRHSNKPSNNKVDGSLFINDELQKTVELQFLRIMGLNSRPRPAKHHKVPDYILDLYRWFRQGDTSNNEEFNSDNEDDDDNDVSQSKSSNSLIGLTTDDLSEINSIEHEDEIRHHRVARKRRSTQSSRVTLKGLSSTIISHKTSPKPSIDGQLTQTHTSSLSNADFSSNTNNHQAHIKFNINLPSDETLTGAELRLYRHSLYEVQKQEHNEQPNYDHSSITSRRQRFLSKHNNFWPMYHWSIRYKQQLNSSSNYFYQTPFSIESAFDNSHPSKVNNSSGEEYSRSTLNRPYNNDYYMQRVNIYHLLRPFSGQSWKTNKITNKLLKTSKLIDTQVIDVRDSGWLSFDVFPAVEWWIKYPTENYGLLVTLKDYKGRNETPHFHLLVLNPENSLVQSTSQQIDADHEWHEVQPLIITFSNNAHIHKHNLINKEKLLNRSKRDRKRNKVSGQRLKNNNKKNNNNNKKKKHKASSRQRDYCRRHQMYFDFKDVGWMDWIVAPPGYQAFYCKGECSYPMSQHMNKTNHAIIQSLINSVNPAVVPEPCCVPTDLSSVTLLYFDHNDKVVLKSYPNMVVEGCGCS